MNPDRRTLLKGTLMYGAIAIAVPAGLLKPSRAIATWSAADFTIEGLDALMKQIGASNAVIDERIKIEAPQVANNASVVPVSIISSIPGTQSIAIIADNNPLPLLGTFEFDNGAQAFAATRIKLRSTSPVRALVKAGNQYYMNERVVKVTIGGCGG